MSGCVAPTKDKSSKLHRVLPFDRQYHLTGTKSPAYLFSINCAIPRFDITLALNLLGGGFVIIFSEVKWCLASHCCIALTQLSLTKKKLNVVQLLLM